MSRRPLPEFAAMILEMLEPLGGITVKAMFGGWCFFRDGLAFALIADEVFYLKADDGNRDDFDSAGCGPFKPFPDKPMTMSYYEAPVGLFDEPDELRA